MGTTDKYSASAGRDVARADGRFSEHDWESIAAQFGFSERELEIVKLVFDDKCDKEIGSELAMSRHTVHTHFGRLYKKTGVHSRAQLIMDVFWHYVRTHS